MTINERIEKEVKVYSDMRERMIKDPFYKGKDIEALVLHDWLVKGYMSEEIVKRLKKLF